MQTLPLCLHDRLSCHSEPLRARPDLFALIACQRSGTHLLRKIINSNPCIALFSEPFTPDPNPVYWSSYVRTLAANEFPPLVPADAMALLERHMLVIKPELHGENKWS